MVDGKHIEIIATKAPVIPAAFQPITLTNIVAHPAGPTLGLAPVSQARVSAFGVEYSGQDLSGFANPFSWKG